MAPGTIAGMRTTAELREGFLSFFESKGHLRRPSASLVPRARRPVDAPDERGDAAADAVLPRSRAAARAADHDRAEVLPHARHRGGRARHLPPDVLRDARQLLVRAVLQGRRDRVRDRVHARPPAARLGPSLGQRPRGRPGARARSRRGRDRRSGSGSGCHRSASCSFRRRRTSGRSAGRGRAGRTPRSTTTGERRPAAASPTACRAVRAASASSSSGTSSSWSTSSMPTGRSRRCRSRTSTPVSASSAPRGSCSRCRRSTTPTATS